MKRFLLFLIVLAGLFATQAPAATLPSGAVVNSDIRFGLWTNVARLTSATNTGTTGQWTGSATQTWYYAVQPTNAAGAGVLSAISNVTIRATTEVARVAWQFAGGEHGVRLWRGTASTNLSSYLAMEAGATNFSDTGAFTNWVTNATTAVTATNAAGIVLADGTALRKMTDITGTNVVLKTGDTMTGPLTIGPWPLTLGTVSSNWTVILNSEAVFRQIDTSAYTRVSDAGVFSTGGGQFGSVTVLGGGDISAVGGSVTASIFNDGLSGQSAEFEGQFVGNAYGATNYQSTNLVGTLPDGVWGTNVERRIGKLTSTGDVTALRFNGTLAATNIPAGDTPNALNLANSTNLPASAIAAGGTYSSGNGVAITNAGRNGWQYFQAGYPLFVSGPSINWDPENKFLTIQYPNSAGAVAGWMMPPMGMTGITAEITFKTAASHTTGTVQFAVLQQDGTQNKFYGTIAPSSTGICYTTFTTNWTIDTNCPVFFLYRNTGTETNAVWFGGMKWKGFWP